MFLTSFNIYFVFGYACFIYYALWLRKGFTTGSESTNRHKGIR